jgi:hypothetical protein
MSEFIDLSLQYPTALFSVLLAAVLIYWLFVIIGAVDIDALDFDFDFDLDGDLDMDFDMDAEAGTGAGRSGSFVDILARLNLSEVPFTVSLSLVVLCSWVLSMIAVDWLGPIASSLLVATGVALGCFVLSLGVTRQLIVPLKPIFAKNEAPEKRSLVGQTCVIKTLRVDDKYGQAEVDDGAAGFIIQVRSASASQLVKDTEALIYDYDGINDVFHVKPLYGAVPDLETDSV